jgi:L-serine dehydratase
MTTSLFDLYKIDIGPSSSHTMGPMRAACRFVRELGGRGMLVQVERVQAELYGSLALTGLGHATDRAVLLGLAGNEPGAIDPAVIESTVAAIRAARQINLAGTRAVLFDEARDLLLHRKILFPPGAHIQHPNGIRFTAYDAAGAVVEQRTFFSIGGGFIAEDGPAKPPKTERQQATVPFPFQSAAELLATAQANELSISHSCWKTSALLPCATRKPRRLKWCAPGSSTSGRRCKPASSAASPPREFCLAAWV